MMEASTIYSSEMKNNLELYLTDVFERECVFQIDKEELEFIQTGIETLVQDIVDEVLARLNDKNGLTHIIDNDQYIKYIVEVYFQIKDDVFPRESVARNRGYKETSVIKVGSFYDGARNNFPDEFDFIFLLLGVAEPWRFDHNMDMDSFIRSTIDAYVHKNEKPVQYPSHSDKHQVIRRLELDKSLEVHGPAYMLQFVYSNGLGETRHIHVDLVPAYKIIDSNTREWFVGPVREYVEPKTFREEILAAESSLFVGEYFAFTEIEKHFMNNILSRKHMKVYRIIKYILNGHGDGEKLENYLKTTRGSRACYTSYRIKILIIYHHESCTNINKEDFGPCVLQVLDELSSYETAEEFPKFINRDEYPNLIFKTVFKLLPYLKSTISAFRSMQTSGDSYTYEKGKTMSVSKQYLDFCMAEKQTLQ